MTSQPGLGSWRTLLTDLPPELAVDIVEAVGARCDALPDVCLAWRALFARNSPAEPSFRHAAARHFGVRKKPRHAARLSWGQLYVRLRAESCNLCTNRAVLAGAYYASVGFAALDPAAPLTLFPVCGACVDKAARRRNGSGDTMIVVDRDVVCVLELFREVAPGDLSRRAHELVAFDGRLLPPRMKERPCAHVPASASCSPASGLSTDSTSSMASDGASRLRKTSRAVGERVEVYTLYSLVKAFAPSMQRQELNADTWGNDFSDNVDNEDEDTGDEAR
jgi:hypothetical protein